MKYRAILRRGHAATSSSMRRALHMCSRWASMFRIVKIFRNESVSPYSERTGSILEGDFPGRQCESANIPPELLCPDTVVLLANTPFPQYPRQPPQGGHLGFQDNPEECPCRIFPGEPSGCSFTGQHAFQMQGISQEGVKRGKQDIREREILEQQPKPVSLSKERLSAASRCR